MFIFVRDNFNVWIIASPVCTEGTVSPSWSRHLTPSSQSKESSLIEDNAGLISRHAGCRERSADVNTGHPNPPWSCYEPHTIKRFHGHGHSPVHFRGFNIYFVEVVEVYYTSGVSTFLFFESSTLRGYQYFYSWSLVHFSGVQLFILFAFTISN
jgi:hypothetical protein